MAGSYRRYAYSLIGQPAKKPRTRCSLLFIFCISLLALIQTYSWLLPSKPLHPIDTLIATAQNELARLLSTQTSTLASSASAYRTRRNRHPPPGFDLWHKFATSHNTLIIEEFWDQIYDDLEPFWGIDAEILRDLSLNIDDNAFHFRNGKVSARSSEDHIWMGIWTQLLRKIEEWVPDVDIAMNIRDESSVMVPWETVESSRKRGAAPPSLLHPENVLQNFTGQLEDRDAGYIFHPLWMTEPAIPLWTIFTATCPPFSPARSGSIPDLTLPPPLLMPATAPLHTYHGFVANWTLATDPCQHPHLGGLHGSFVRPLRKSTTGQLIPVFSTAKMAGNNDILVPAAMYYSGWDMFEADPVEINSTSWNQKANAIAWRGRASGGISTASNFMRFQRHRFLAMTNATTVAAAEACPQTNPRLGQNRKKRRWHGHSGASATSAPQHPNANCNDSTPGSIPFYTLPNPSTYPLPLAHSSSTRSTLSSWLSTWSPPTSTGFTNLTCRVPSGPNGTCPYNDDYFSPLPPLNLSAQINGFKYLPDIDGNSFSGRYRGFLLSTSVPLKATIYKEWHDKRLVPWAHFVPFDNTFVDLFGVMEYFIGDGVGRGGHDDQARRIAEDGKAWAERVLRKEDMEVYMLRLLLEWARVCDLQRERIGFVGDLV